MAPAPPRTATGRGSAMEPSYLAFGVGSALAGDGDMILLAPTAYHRLIHPEGERATARGAGAAGATLVVSSFATTAVEDIAAAATQPLWFQLYVQRDRGFTRELVGRAEAAGCRALCVT